MVYLYPCLYLAIVGHWQGGRLVSGHYRRLASATTGPDGFIQLEWEPEQAECRLGDIQS